MMSARPCFLRHYDAERSQGSVTFVRFLICLFALAGAIRFSGWWLLLILAVVVAWSRDELRYRRTMRMLRQAADEKHGLVFNVAGKGKKA